MAAEAVPGSVPYDDNMRITAVAQADNPKSAAVLIAADDLTYSLKTFNRTRSQATVEDPRLTLKRVLQRPGKVTETVEVQYVFGDASDVAATVLTEGTELHLAVRYSTPNADAWAAADVADILHVQCGVQSKDAPVENGVQTITQMLYVIAPSEDDVAIIA
tara:strand:+ start:1262 stop:1744 length:483 start_codon:yes stop_codon:yes gene_type:complete